MSVHCAVHILCGLIDSECWMHYLWTALSVCLLGFPDNVQPTKEFIYISEEPSNDSGVHLKLCVFLSIFSFLNCKASFVLISSQIVSLLWIVTALIHVQFGLRGSDINNQVQLFKNTSDVVFLQLWICIYCICFHSWFHRFVLFHLICSSQRKQVFY